MSNKIYGIPVGTPMNPAKIDPAVSEDKIASSVASYMEEHPITPSSIGARPDSWTPTAEQVGARPNDWLPTIAEIGAAPSGYGLGVQIGKMVTDCNLAITNGWYATSANAINTPYHGDTALTQCPMFVMARNEKVHQVYWAEIAGVKGLIHRYSEDTGNTWSAWAWENPPMMEGREYLTIERYINKPVYAKLINCGKFPAGSAKTVEHQIANMETVVDCEGITDNVGAKLPYYMPDGSVKPIIAVQATINSITVMCNLNNWTTATCYVILKYTKTTD